MNINSVEELRKLYAWPTGRAARKILPTLEKHSINFIQKSPFLVLSSYDQEGRCDASPRGGKPGFVLVSNENTIIIPDSKGNNRVDSLFNIVETGKVGLLFLIPGIDETLRINGTAKISTDTELLEFFKHQNRKPISCLVVHIEELFLHCAKALMRSKLWGQEYKIAPSDFPTMGIMLAEQLKEGNPEESREDMIKRYLPDL